MKREYHGFADWTAVGHEFSCDVGKEPSIVFAAYATPAYEGDAVVIFKRGGKWWMVRGSHCSCFGLEHQWKPEAFEPRDHFEALAKGKRIVHGVCSEGELPEATDEAVDKWLRRHGR